MRKSFIAAHIIAAIFLIANACGSPKGPAQGPTATTTPPQPGPTGFITSDLNLPTLEASTGEATISVTVTNTGTAEATHDVNLLIDGQVISTKTVDLAGGASQIVSFDTILDHAGTLNVTIDQVSGILHWAGPN